jgi:hypothetical protein
MIKNWIPAFAGMTKIKAQMIQKIKTGMARITHPGLSATPLKRGFAIFWNDIRRKWLRGLIVLVLASGAFYLWGISSALLWLLFLLFLVYEWENRIIAVLALLSLASCPVLLSLKKDDLAETMAVYAYFFLVMTVVLQIVEYKREN